MKKFAVLLVCLLCLISAAQAEPLPPYAHEFMGETVALYESNTLKYTIEEFAYETSFGYVTKLWMADPGRQIRKATAVWETSLAMPADMAQTVEGAVLAINGSGYVSPSFPEIPDNYPGTSKDYYFTPLGSLTITNGEVFRSLDGVPYYGLTLQKDGLHMHVGEDIESIMPHEPTQTWSFYERCPMIQDHQSILDTEWRFANNKAIRTIIAKMDDNNYIILTVTHKGSGLSLIDCVEFLMEYFDPIWAYDLDGGPSSALMYKQTGEEEMTIVYGGKREDADMMVFVD